jgi:LuxR family maltose regulon positive regulatory protein
LVRVLEACGDFDAAWAAWREGDRVRQQFAMMPVLSSNLDVYGVRLWLATGQLTEAAQWVERWLKQTDDRRALLTRELESIHAGHVLLALDRPQEVITVLSPYVEDSTRQQRHGRLLQSLVLVALAQRALGQNAAAIASLERVLRMAESENYTRLFLDEGEAMRLLIEDFRLLIEKQPSPARTEPLARYIRRLLAAFPKPAINHQQHLHRAADAVQVSTYDMLLEPLSDRELEVLRLLAAGLSNSQIAERLVVAVGTIKTHIHNIYGKLGAQNRAQAVTRATELHLL